MLTHTRAAVAPRRALPSLPLQPPDPWAALLDSLGAIEDEENVIVLGRDGPDLMCALLRAGAPPQSDTFPGAPPLNPVYDFSYDGVMRSVEESVTRLGIDRIDILHIHDPDEHFAEALSGAYPALDRLRAEGTIKAVGAGMNQGNAAGQVIENQQRAWRDVMCVGRFRVVQTAPRNSLEIAYGVVRRVSHEAAGQGYAGNLGQWLGGAGESTPQRVQEGGLRSGPRGVNSAYVKSGGIQPDLQAIAESDEGITGQPLSAFDALQQEPRLERRQFQIGRYRRVQIGGDVERWLHTATNSKTIKNPSPLQVRRWVLDDD